MKMRILIIIILLFPSFAFSTPKKIQMIFLSPKTTADILKFIDQSRELKKFKVLSQNDFQNCTPMGDGCFHPQYGYIENNFELKNKPQPQLVKEEEIKLKTFNAAETSLVKCDKNNYFDIYCGQEKKNTSFASVFVWFDISSSLKSVDFNTSPDHCARRTFMEKVVAKCKSKVAAYVYNTSIKEAGDLASVCLSYGTNDEKRLMSWMKDSNANQLLIVTDIDEVSRPMRDFLEENGAVMIGEGVKAFTVDDLIKYALEFEKICN